MAALHADTDATLAYDKYPSTPHFPFSPGFGDGDFFISNDSSSVFCGEEIVLTEKLDG